MPPTLEKQLYVYHIQPRLSIPHLPRQRCITFPDRRLGSRPVDGRGRGGEVLFPGIGAAFPALRPPPCAFSDMGLFLYVFYDTLNKLHHPTA